jgi:hypothetical protein
VGKPLLSAICLIANSSSFLSSLVSGKECILYRYDV